MIDTTTYITLLRTAWILQHFQEHISEIGKVDDVMKEIMADVADKLKEAETAIIAAAAIGLADDFPEDEGGDEE